MIENLFHSNAGSLDQGVGRIYKDAFSVTPSE
jgi:hypothetical protein